MRRSQAVQPERGAAGQLADAAKQNQQIEQPPRGAVGHRRGASGLGGRHTVLGQEQVDDLGASLGAQSGRDGEQGLGAAGKMSGEIESRGRGQRDRSRGGFRPGGGSFGLARRPAPSRIVKIYRIQSSARMASNA